MKKKINFVSTGNNRMASFRMRVDIPAQTINEHSTEFEADISRGCLANADINVFSKHWNKEQDATDIMITDSKTIFDVCDDHFDRAHGKYYAHMCANADLITCNTSRMQERIYECTGRLAVIIPDPITFPFHEFKYTDDPKFLWYGSQVNIFSIYGWMYDLPNLTLVSDANLPALPPHVKAVRWEPGLVESIIHDFDIVVIPKNNEEWAKTKSPNRAVDALHSGRFVITDFEEVYGVDLDPFIHVGDLASGLELYHNYPQTAEQMVKAGQNYVKTFNNHKTIYEGWVHAFNSSEKGDHGICCH